MFALEVANFASDKTKIILTETKNSDLVKFKQKNVIFGF